DRWKLRWVASDDGDRIDLCLGSDHWRGNPSSPCCTTHGHREGVVCTICVGPGFGRKNRGICNMNSCRWKGSGRHSSLALAFDGFDGKEADRCAPRNDMKVAHRTEAAGYGRIRRSFFSLESFFQRQFWPARLALLACALALVILLGSLFISYGLRLYVDWHQTRLLHEAASMLQEGRFSEAMRAAREL